jgi:CO/xanthine dehydrogenase FAD-binding subunit
VVESYRPASLAEALEIRRKTGALPFAGGTDLMVRYRAKNGLAPAIDGPVLFIDAIQELRGLVLTPDNLSIGASVPLAVIADDPGVRKAYAAAATAAARSAAKDATESAARPGQAAGPDVAGRSPGDGGPGGTGRYPADAGGTAAALNAVPEVLRRAAADLGAPALRQRATIAGNVANASPAGDTLAALYALNAMVVLSSPDGSRTLSVAGFVTGPGKTLLAGDELITEILIPRPLPDWCYWRKVGTRRANALTKVSLSAAAVISTGAGRGGPAAAGGLITSFTLAFGAVGPVVVRAPRAEELIIGRTLSDLALMDAGALSDLSAELADAAAPAIRPIDDQRSTARYRKTVALNLIGDAISSLASYAHSKLIGE